MENTANSQNQNQSVIGDAALGSTSCGATGAGYSTSAAPTESPNEVRANKITSPSRPGLKALAIPVDGWSKIPIVVKYILCIAFLWLPNIYKYFLADSAWHADKDRPGSTAYNHGRAVDDDVDAVQVRWRRQIRSLIFQWRMMQIMASGMIAAPIAFEQIQGVDNNIWTRTAVIMATICAFASIMVTTAYIMGKSRMCSPEIADRWAQSSGQDQKLGALWFILASPLMWLLWSIILFLGAILVYVWMKMSAQGVEQQLTRRQEIFSKVITVLSPLSVTILLMMVVIQMLLILDMFVRLEGEREIGLDESSATLPV